MAEIHPEDLRIAVCRTGQPVAGTTCNPEPLGVTVRITHLPTLIVTEAWDRYALEAKSKALLELHEILDSSGSE